MVKYLIENNLVNVDQKDINGRSALDVCVNGKYEKCVEVIMQKIKNVD